MIFLFKKFQGIFYKNLSYFFIIQNFCLVTPHQSCSLQVRPLSLTRKFNQPPVLVKTKQNLRQFVAINTRKLSPRDIIMKMSHLHRNLIFLRVQIKVYNQKFPVGRERSLPLNYLLQYFPIMLLVTPYLFNCYGQDLIREKVFCFQLLNNMCSEL